MSSLKLNSAFNLIYTSLSILLAHTEFAILFGTALQSCAHVLKDDQWNHEGGGAAPGLMLVSVKIDS